MARTRNRWLPGVRSVYSMGDSHCSNGSASIWHSKSVTGSLAVKLKVAVKVPSSELTTALLIVVTGAVESSTTVHAQWAGLGSTASCRSTARTRRKWSPGVRSVNSAGSGHSVKAAPSRAHSKVAIGSSLSKAKVAMAVPVSGSVA
jgi:hypothetical protein